MSEQDFDREFESNSSDRSQSNPGFFQQAGNFISDAAVDTAVDGFINKGIEGIASNIPGGQTVEKMLETEIDLNVNNAINSEINKGFGGMLEDVEKKNLRSRLKD